MCCSVVQCVAVCCSVLQCVAVCYSMLQCVTVCCSVLHYVAVCCIVLQYVAVCCSLTSPRIARQCSVCVCVCEREKEREREIHTRIRGSYRVVSISRLLKIVGLFCQRDLQKRLYSAFIGLGKRAP